MSLNRYDNNTTCSITSQILADRYYLTIQLGAGKNSDRFYTKLNEITNHMTHMTFATAKFGTTAQPVQATRLTHWIQQRRATLWHKPISLSHSPLSMPLTHALLPVVHYKPEALWLIQEIRNELEAREIPEIQLFLRFHRSLVNLTTIELLKVLAIVKALGKRGAHNEPLSPKLYKGWTNNCEGAMMVRVLNGEHQGSRGWIIKRIQDNYSLSLAKERCPKTGKIISRIEVEGLKADDLELYPDTNPAMKAKLFKLR